MVAMTIIKQCIVVPWKMEIPIQQWNCKFCPIYWHLLLQGKKVFHFIFETRLFKFGWLIWWWPKHTSMKFCMIFFLLQSKTAITGPDLRGVNRKIQTSYSYKCLSMLMTLIFQILEYFSIHLSSMSFQAYYTY
jgi:hypothetical protein